MKDTSISFFHSMIVIIFCLILVGGFIFLSTRKLEKEVDTVNQAIAIDNMYSILAEKPKYKMKHIDVSFQYDTRQVDDMHVVNYEITNNLGDNKITQVEIDVLLNCYRNDVCDNASISQKIEQLINNYKHFIVKDGVVIVYGLYPEESKESFGEIESSVFVISEELFVHIINPIYLKTNKKYDNIRKNFLISNVDIDYNDYTNIQRIEQKNEMMQNAMNDIMEEQSYYVKEDIKLLHLVAESVSMIKKETS